jgi:hypothetical protein
MSNNKAGLTLLITILAAGTAFGTVSFCSGQEGCIFGYPYSSNEAGGDGQQYAAIGSLFTLSGQANITSISCLMKDIGDPPNNLGVVYNFRFAIYRDNGGSIGALVSQTGTGGISYRTDAWMTLSFDQPVHLTAGGYWLMVVHNAKQFVNIYANPSVPGAKTVDCHIGSLNFPASMSATTISNNRVECIYASGEGQSSPMPSPTPTPAPTPNATSPTPPSNGTSPINSQPTPTPAPTPSPTPNASLPALAVSCVSSTSLDSFRVQIKGALTFHGYGVATSPIAISYSANNGGSWQDITCINTETNGSFLAVWVPSAAGNYLIRAVYAGNATIQGISTTVSLTVSSSTSQSTQNVFSVGSNSTVTNLAFDSQNGKLSFTVSGQNGTTGFVDICIAKALVGDISTVKAYIDDRAVNYTASSTSDSWILHFNYHHSNHSITLSLNGAPSTITEQVIPIVIIIAAVACAVATVNLTRRKKL